MYYAGNQNFVSINIILRPELSLFSGKFPPIFDEWTAYICRLIITVSDHWKNVDKHY